MRKQTGKPYLASETKDLLRYYAHRSKSQSTQSKSDLSRTTTQNLRVKPNCIILSLHNAGILRFVALYRILLIDDARYIDTV